MQVVDLSHVISSDMPVFPGTEQPVFQKANTIEKDGFREAKITMYSHTGTHIDAPAHMIEKALCLDDLEIDKYIGTAVIVDVSKSKLSLIDLEALQSYAETINQADFLVLKTGWSRFWGQPNYYSGFPALSKEAAGWLSGFNLKGIGIDAISIDSMDTEDFPIHKLFSEKNILIIENLANLDLISQEIFILSIMPLKTKAADGSPVRAFAILDAQLS
ncbi:putative metal-dependent hydrolase [Desulfosporosinus orientis DSM 765]|uniref:Putative metal-dependent hydrolase n=1 Tax=Desulfosporosinus orientis (strain ATCC 19365 / DSM 765 / NCIMB 8382 / VKM B-1628 / Singapore I) TaxID=768706 RepID=G7W815_DESOD|nr:cyclase family protein [Desulfosporosinus orientis]AET66441.1 putative metal-dependent hydrolase [Desulfosporosinus orientis DSM 765]